MPFAEDLSVFFNAAEFATRTMLAGVEVQGIFDNPYEQSHVGGAGLASSRPTFTLATASMQPRLLDWFDDFAEPVDPLDLRLDINGTAYQVVAHEPDGAGLSVLVLERQA